MKREKEHMKRKTNARSFKRARTIIAMSLSMLAFVGTLFAPDALAQAKKEVISLGDALNASTPQNNVASAEPSSNAITSPGDAPNGTSADDFLTTPDAITYDPVTKTVTISGNCTTDQLYNFVHEGGAGVNVKYVHFSGASCIQTLIHVPDDPDDPSPYVGVGPFFDKYELEAVTADPNATVSFVGKNSRIAPVLPSFFNNCMSLSNIDGLSAWDVSNVTGPYCMSNMFGGCEKLSSLDALAFWNVSRVNGRACMNAMFRYCKGLTSLSGISAWDVSKVAGKNCMSVMFGNCEQLTYLDPLASWNISGAVASQNGVSYMFENDPRIISLAVNPGTGFALNDSMNLPTASWWPTQGTTTSFSTSEMIVNSDNTAQYGNRWYASDRDPYIRDAEPTVAWPVTSKNYNGFNQTIGPETVTVDSIGLMNGIDYAVSYRYATTTTGDSNDSTNSYPVVRNAGTYSASIHLQGRYVGKNDPSFVQQVTVTNQYVDLTFNANGGTFASTGSSTLTLANQTSYSLLSSVETPSKDGSWFAGWKDSTGKDVTIPLTIPASSATYTANWSATPVFSVTFNSNGGSAVATQYIQSGQRAAIPQSPVMPNKSFVDWCTTPDLISHFDFSTPITEDLTLYAQWSDEVALTFNANGGTFFNTESDTLILVNQTVGATVASIETPTRGGMWFAGWTDPAGNPVAFPLTIPSVDTIYTAQWNAEPTYAVTFNSNGGSTVATQYVESGSRATEPPAPTREQRVFGGWFSNTELTNRFDFNTPITEPITLYAKWNPIVVTLTFKAAGGTFASTGTDTLVLENQPVGETLASVESPSKQGVRFNGWTDASGAKVEFPLTIPDTNSTYTATWSTSEIFVVFFNTNGGSSVSTRYVVGGHPLVKPQDPTKAHYRFAGWYSDPDLTSLYDFSAPVTSDLTLYAKWNPIIVTLTFKAAGGTFASTGTDTLTLTNQVAGDAIAEVEVPTLTGAWFEGWENVEGDAVPLPIIVPEVDTTYVADWSINPTYAVHFDSNGGSAVGTQYILSGNLVERPTDPTKEGFEFAGWYSDAALQNRFSFATPITQETTLYAKWTPARIRVNLIFSANGGTFASTGTAVLFLENMPVGDTVTAVETPVKEGEWFAGWTDPAGNPVSFPLTVPTVDTTYTAQWNASPSYAVTFNSNGGSVVATQYVERGSKATEPPAPTRDMKTFAGWFSDAALTNQFDFNTPITEPITLYAKWDPLLVTLTFKANGGIFASTGTDTLVLENQPVGETLASVESPSKQGVWFNGWTDASAAKVEFPLTIPDADTTYTASWATTETFVVMFNTNGGSTVSTRYVIGGNPVVQPQDPTKAHQRFAGWYSDAELTNPYDFSTPVTSDLTLYAKWDPIIVTLTFKANGGTFASTGTDTLTLTNQVAGDAIAEVEVPTLTGAWFEGWENVEGDAVSLPIIVPEVDTTYVADWNVNPTYAVHFDSNGGSAVGTQYVVSGNLVNRPTDPTKAGFVFAGWYSDAALENPFSFATPITHETTLYAKWNPVPVQVTLTFTANGGTFVSTGANVLVLENQQSGDTLASVETPVKDGFTLSGWKDAEGNQVTFPLAIPDTNATYTAVWQATPGPVPPDPQPGPTPDAGGSGSSDTDLIPATNDTFGSAGVTFCAATLALFGCLLATARRLLLARAHKTR